MKKETSISWQHQENLEKEQKLIFFAGEGGAETQKAPEAPDGDLNKPPKIDNKEDIENAANETQERVERGTAKEKATHARHIESEIAGIDSIMDIRKVEIESGVVGGDEYQEQIAKEYANLMQQREQLKQELAHLQRQGQQPPEDVAATAGQDLSTTEEIATTGGLADETVQPPVAAKKSAGASSPENAGEVGEPLSENGEALAGAMRGLGMSPEAAEKFARSLEALATLFKSIKELFGKPQAAPSEETPEDEEDEETTPDEDEGGGAEDATEGDEGGPEAFDPKTVQNPKKEAEELGDLAEKEEELEKKLQDLGKKLDGDTTAEERDTIMTEMQELHTQLKEVEENVQKKEALEKEHERRVGVTEKEWKDALDKSGLPENERAFITMELGGDGDDLVLTMREELNNKDVVKAFTAMGFRVADGTLRMEDAPPELFSEKGQTKLQELCEMAAKISGIEKKNPEPEEEGEGEEKGNEQEDQYFMRGLEDELKTTLSYKVENAAERSFARNAVFMEATEDGKYVLTIDEQLLDGRVPKETLKVMEAHVRQQDPMSKRLYTDPMTREEIIAYVKELKEKIT